MPAKIISFPFSTDDKATIKNALQKGQTIIFATETFYALGCHAFCEDALQKIFQIKGREASKSLPLLINAKMADAFKQELSPQIQALTAKFWAGAMTLVLPAPKWIPRFLIASDGSIAVRHSDDKTVEALLDLVECPLIGTSANISGQPPHNYFPNLVDLFQNQVDLMIDSGTTKGEKASTIVNCMISSPTILRQGELAPHIQEFLDQKF